MEKEKIVEKVRKLFALSQSANEHEAALALENANKLLLKYNLEMSDIQDKKVQDIIEHSVMSAGRIMNWKSMMMGSVMKLNNCTIIISSIRGGQKTIKAIGKPHSVEVSIQMYDYLEQVLERKIRDNRGCDKPSFRLGFANAIVGKVNEIIKARDHKEDHNCRDLVVQEKALVRNYINQTYSNLTTTSNRPSCRDRDSYNSGTQAGRSVSLNSQIR